MSLIEEGRLPGPDRVEIPKAFHPPTGAIFVNTDKEPMTGNGFKQVFEEVRNRAGIVDDINPKTGKIELKKRLTPHSLRAAAEMSFRKIGLDDKLIDVMKNGLKGNYDVLEGYLEIIHKRLDTTYYGKPLEEWETELARLDVEFKALCVYGLREGLSRQDAIERATTTMLEKYPEWARTKDVIASFNARYGSLSSTQARLAEEVA